MMAKQSDVVKPRTVLDLQSGVGVDVVMQWRRMKSIVDGGCFESVHEVQDLVFQLCVCVFDGFFGAQSVICGPGRAEDVIGEMEVGSAVYLLSWISSKGSRKIKLGTVRGKD
ncbi:hypothetical protein L6452_30851 [Arctium lappa]|uniref:Uncharacterized protein n=1 Tax=Arctium lappa TaxID=4217 RepID=A0ACB8ZIF7_ARCLA|nr:hypothetical protein L6452_30851 [Arctium lappa]